MERQTGRQREREAEAERVRARARERLSEHLVSVPTVTLSGQKRALGSGRVYWALALC